MDSLTYSSSADAQYRHLATVLCSEFVRDRTYFLLDTSRFGHVADDMANQFSSGKKPEPNGPRWE